MAINKTINSIIVAAPDADFTKHYYVGVYAGANATPTINGIPITMGAGSELEIIIKSISATANVYLLGHNKNVANGTQIIGGSFTGNNSTVPPYSGI